MSVLEEKRKTITHWGPGLSLDMRPANERRRYIVTIIER